MKGVVQVLVWAAMMHCVYWLAFQLSAYILGPLIGLFVSDNAVFLSAPITLILIMLKFRHEQNGKRSDQISLLLFAAAEGRFSSYCNYTLTQNTLSGIAMGRLFDNAYLSNIQPLAFLTPLAAALLCVSAEEQLNGMSRQMLLGCLAIVSALPHILLGLTLSQVSLAYVMLAGFYMATTLGTAQVFFGLNMAEPGVDSVGFH